MTDTTIFLAATMGFFALALVAMAWDAWKYLRRPDVEAEDF